VRLGGCNLDCAYCDTRYAREEHTAMPFDTVVEKALALRAQDWLVCVTGGEPLLQDEALALVTRLADEGLTVLLETNGSLDIGPVDPRVVRIMDVKCPGSGMQGRNRLSNIELLSPRDEVKFVLTNKEDFDWAVDFVRRHQLLEKVQVLFSPAHTLLDGPTLARWILETGLNIRLQLQLHKILWPDANRGK
jgi:7-carboxy-7-deazaguanine synthase